MKINSIKIKNTKSFKEKKYFLFNKDLNILIGPNGSGKSNLLDIITIVLRSFFLPAYQLSLKWGEASDFRILTEKQSPFLPLETYLEKFTDNQKEENLIEIEFRIDVSDIDNIKSIKKNKQIYLKSLEKIDCPDENIKKLDFVDKWNLSEIKKGRILKFVISNTILVKPPEESLEKRFLTYLLSFDLFFQLSIENGNTELKPIYLYFSPYRSIDTPNMMNINPSENLIDVLSQISGSHSRTQTSLTRIAALFFALKKRELEVSAKRTGYEKRWKELYENKLLNNNLSKIDYTWDLIPKISNKSIYELTIRKNKNSYSINKASSGEKELFNFLFGIAAFVKKGGVVIIDEPELHLHPSWQNLLVGLFKNLSSKTSCQFIISTHSHLFVNSDTLSNVTRLYKNSDNSTQFKKIPKKELNLSRKLLHIVNSQNNEKVFFADKVILVEGLSDKLIFTKLLEKLRNPADKNQIIEVLDVGTKQYLEEYRIFLNIINVKNYIIADQDYLKKVGTEEIKQLFISSPKKFYKEVLKSDGSTDTKKLIQELEKTIRTGDKNDLIKALDYIKSRHTSLKPRITTSEQNIINNFTNDYKNRCHIYILSKGELEDYLPSGYNSSTEKIQNAIELTKEKIFNSWLKSEKRSSKITELKKIINSIILDKI